MNFICKIAIKNANGKYLGVTSQDHKNPNIFYQIDHVMGWEQFSLFSRRNRKVSIQTAHEGFIFAKHDGSFGLYEDDPFKNESCWFEMILNESNGTISLKNKDNLFVGVDQYGRIYQTTRMTKNEQFCFLFTQIPLNKPLAILDFHKHFICCFPKGEIIHKNWSKKYEQFKFSRVKAGKYAIQSIHGGKYIGIHPDDKTILAAKINNYEQFEIKRIKNGQYSIKSHHNRFIGISKEGKMFQTNHRRGWETFEFSCFYHIKAKLNSISTISNNTTVNRTQSDQSNVFQSFCLRMQALGIKSTHGYLVIDKKGSPKVSKLFTNLGKFRIIEVKNLGFGIQSKINGNFLGVHQNGSVYSINHLKRWETFKFVENMKEKEEGKFRIVTVHNSYLGVSKSGKFYSIPKDDLRTNGNKEILFEFVDPSTNIKKTTPGNPSVPELPPISYENSMQFQGTNSEKVDPFVY